MKIIKPSAVPAEPATSPLFTGEVSRQPILTPEMSQHFNLGIVNFPAGVRNKMHTHSSDQVLFVTTVGDIVHITADEKHWHGATPHSDFSHIALTAKGSTTTQVEP
jgi:quercetin dioxygenase-like cupin family protein